MRASQEREQDVAADAQQPVPQDQREARRHQLHPGAVAAAQGACVCARVRVCVTVGEDAGVQREVSVRRCSTSR